MTRRIGFLVDFRLFRRAEGLRAEVPMVNFALAFRDWFDEVVLISRVFPATSGLATPYEIPEDRVRVVPLPPYPRIHSLYLRPWRYWPAIDRALGETLPDLDALWLNVGHPVSLRALTLSRRHPNLHCFGVRRGSYERDAALRASGPPLVRGLAGRVMGRNLRHFEREARRLQLPCIAFVGAGHDAELRESGVDWIGMVSSLLTDRDVATGGVAREELAADLLGVGRLEREKGFEVLIDALPRIACPGGRPATLRLVGSGAGEPELRERARSHGLGDRVCFDGHVPFGPELFARYASAQLLVIPSHTEGVPKAAYEAMAFGRPVLSTAVGGLPDVVGPDGERGRLVPAGDPEALAVAATGMLADPAALAEMGARAREFARGVTLEGQVRRLLEHALPWALERAS
jgi:glycosyltransferase involved in cell wall biosynthesis